MTSNNFNGTDSYKPICMLCMCVGHERIKCPWIKDIKNMVDDDERKEEKENIDPVSGRNILKVSKC